MRANTELVGGMTPASFYYKRARAIEGEWIFMIYSYRYPWDASDILAMRLADRSLQHAFAETLTDKAKVLGCVMGGLQDALEISGSTGIGSKSVSASLSLLAREGAIRCISEIRLNRAGRMVKLYEFCAASSAR